MSKERHERIWTDEEIEEVTYLLTTTAIRMISKYYEERVITPEELDYILRGGFSIN